VQAFAGTRASPTEHSLLSLHQQVSSVLGCEPERSGVKFHHLGKM